MMNFFQLYFVICMNSTGTITHHHSDIIQHRMPQGHNCFTSQNLALFRPENGCHCVVSAQRILVETFFKTIGFHQCSDCFFSCGDLIVKWSKCNTNITYIARNMSQSNHYSLIPRRFLNRL